MLKYFGKVNTAKKSRQTKGNPQLHLVPKIS